MADKKKVLSQACLYLVLDRQVNSYDELFQVLKRAVRGGVDIVQLRDKFGPSREILGFTRNAVRYLRGRVPFIVNDRADIAFAGGADGVHLGQEDLPVAEARRILGPRAIIGRSCQTLAHVRRAEAEGADYIGFGSIFRTKTKPERSPMDLNVLTKVLRSVKIPLFAIGGIDQENVALLLSSGVRRVAVTRAISSAADPAVAAREIKNALDARPA